MNIIKAYCFARNYHGNKNQKRKYTNERYIVHPLEVAKIVRKVGGTKNMICAALLHDTVEDTDATIEQILFFFGEEVAQLVNMLTNKSRPSDGNRASRKLLNQKQLELASPEAKTIKLADIISNTKSIVQHDPDFAKVYIKEKIKLLEVLKEGEQTLYTQAQDILSAAKEKLRLI